MQLWYDDLEEYTPCCCLNKKSFSVVYLQSIMYFEMVETPSIPLKTRCISYMQSFVFVYMRASWFLTSTRQLIETLTKPQPFLIETALTGRLSIHDIVEAVKCNDITIVPLILSHIVPHMVLLVADKTRHRVVYYDPHGSSPLNEIRLVSNLVSDAGVLQLLNTIADAGEHRLSIFYSPLREQGMLMTCGAHCKQVLERVLLFPEIVTLLPLSIQIGAERRINL